MNIQQTIKSPSLKNGNNIDANNGISIPIMQQGGLKKTINQYDEASYYQQLLLNHAKQQQQQIYSSNLIPDSMKAHYAHQAQLQHNQLKNFDDHLIIPMQQAIQANMTQHYDIYTDSNKLNLNNGTNNNRPKINPPNHKHTPNGSSNERPILPPPPIPNNQISDLQQIQQQMIKKKLTDISINNNGTNNNGTTNNRMNGNDYGNNTQQGIEQSNSYELPPPPSPPSMFGNFNNTNTNGSSHINGNSYQRHQILPTSKGENDFDMPLPPPPLDLNDHDSNLNHQPISPPLPPPLIHHSNNNNNTNNNSNNTNSLPPPPPLPPLVESDTTSSSSSLSINNNNINNTTSNQSKFNSSLNEEVKSARNNYLDDISQRRFQLRSTAGLPNKTDTSSLADESRTKETSNGNSDNKQPWTKSADVAAIIDFVRNYRPYVRDSSDDDDEDSEWDS